MKKAIVLAVSTVLILLLAIFVRNQIYDEANGKDIIRRADEINNVRILSDNSLTVGIFQNCTDSNDDTFYKALKSDTFTTDVNEGLVVNLDSTNTDCNNEYVYSALGNIVNVAETYFNRAYQVGDLVYEHKRIGMYGPDLYAHGTDDATDEGKFAIVCNVFVNACLKGTTFEGSRYALGTDEMNLEAEWAWISDGTGEYAVETDKDIFSDDASSYPYAYDYMYSSQLAKYCDDHGLLKEVVANDENSIKPGDVIFSGASATAYKGINHCGIVLNVGRFLKEDGTAVNYVNVMEAWKAESISGTHTGVRINRTVSKAEGKWTYYATLPVSAYPYKVNCLYSKELDLTSGENAIIDAGDGKTYQPGIYTFYIYHDMNMSYDSFVASIFYATSGIRKTYQTCKSENCSEITIYAEEPFTFSIRHTKAYSSHVTKIEVYKGIKV